MLYVYYLSFKSNSNEEENHFRCVTFSDCAAYFHLMAPLRKSGNKNPWFNLTICFDKYTNIKVFYIDIKHQNVQFA